MTLHTEIQNQIQLVHTSYELWEISDKAYEDAAWKRYEAEQAKLDALIKESKQGVAV